MIDESAGEKPTFRRFSYILHAASASRGIGADGKVILTAPYCLFVFCCIRTFDSMQLAANTDYFDCVEVGMYEMQGIRRLGSPRKFAQTGQGRCWWLTMDAVQ
jgi:hypothetical protein